MERILANSYYHGPELDGQPELVSVIREERAGTGRVYICRSHNRDSFSGDDDIQPPAGHGNGLVVKLMGGGSDGPTSRFGEEERELEAAIDASYGQMVGWIPANEVAVATCAVFRKTIADNGSPGEKERIMLLLTPQKAQDREAYRSHFRHHTLNGTENEELALVMKEYRQDLRFDTLVQERLMPFEAERLATVVLDKIACTHARRVARESRPESYGDAYALTSKWERNYCGGAGEQYLKHMPSQPEADGWTCQMIQHFRQEIRHYKEEKKVGLEYVQKMYEDFRRSGRVVISRTEYECFNKYTERCEEMDAKAMLARQAIRDLLLIAYTLNQVHERIPTRDNPYPAIFDSQVADSQIVRTHGDIHLGNIYFKHDVPDYMIATLSYREIYQATRIIDPIHVAEYSRIHWLSDAAMYFLSLRQQGVSGEVVAKLRYRYLCRMGVQDDPRAYAALAAYELEKAYARGFTQGVIDKKWEAAQSARFVGGAIAPIVKQFLKHYPSLDKIEGLDGYIDRRSPPAATLRQLPSYDLLHHFMPKPAFRGSVPQRRTPGRAG